MSGCNYGRVLNILRFRVCLVSAYANVTLGSEYAWIRINNALRQGSKYAWSTFHRVLNRLPVLNMARLWICEVYTGWLICLNKPKYVLIMFQYAWICLNNVEHDWICRHVTEKTECWISLSVWCSTYYEVTVQITEPLSRQAYSEHCQTFKMEPFAKRIMP